MRTQLVFKYCLVVCADLVSRTSHNPILAVCNALSLVMSLSALNHPWCLKKLAVFNAALQTLQPSTLGWKLQEGISRPSQGTLSVECRH